jgi:hypothetical protein
MSLYIRGAFIAYEPGGYPNQKRVIPFRFNPEGLSRGFTIDAAQVTEGVQGAPGAQPSASTEQAADASAGTLKQTFSVTIRLDFVDRLESAVTLDPTLGILPEIAALEDLLYPADAAADASSDGKEAVKAKPARPTVLLIWGRKRRFPVRISQMTVNETLHNAALNPTRAEVEVQVEVLRDGDARNNPAVQEALNFTNDNRKQLSRLFLDRTAAQNTIVPTV